MGFLQRKKPILFACIHSVHKTDNTRHKDAPLQPLCTTSHNMACIKSVVMIHDCTYIHIYIEQPETRVAIYTLY